MDRSESLAEMAKALSKFQGSLRSVPKGLTNPFFKSKYADLDAIWEVCRKLLAENGLALIQATIEGADDKLHLETLLLHTSGEYLSSLYPLTPMRQVQGGWALASDPQAIGSCITYARRYAMSAMLGISTEEDDDAEKGMAREPKTQGAKAAAPAQQISDRPDWASFWAGKDRAKLHGFFDIEDKPGAMLRKAQAIAVLQTLTLAQVVDLMRKEYETALLMESEPDVASDEQSSVDNSEPPEWFGVDNHPNLTPQDDPRGDPKQLTPAERRMEGL